MNNEHLPISRRRLLAGTSAVAAAGLLDAFPWQAAFAKAAMLNTQAPYFYRFKLGNSRGPLSPMARCRSASPRTISSA
jgi:hypothetical protein